MASSSTARISVRVTPRGGRDSIDGWDGDVLRVRVAAAPAGGEANKAVIALLAKKLAVPKSSIAIVSGTSSRSKIVSIAEVPLGSIRAAFASVAKQ